MHKIRKHFFKESKLEIYIIGSTIIINFHMYLLSELFLKLRLPYLVINPKIRTTLYHKILKYVVHKCVIQLSFQIRLKLVPIYIISISEKA